MDQFPRVILGGDTFSDVIRALYDLHMYWNLTDPDYCVKVMHAAYEGGCRAFDFSFPNVQDMFLKFRNSVDEPVCGVANPTWLQGCKLSGVPLQYCRNRIIKTYTEIPGFVPVETAELVRDHLSKDSCMVFGYDPAEKPLSAREIASIYLDEDAYQKRLDEIGQSKYVLIGGTDADWLFTLHREDLIARMAQIVRSRGQIPALICHYASLVLPRAYEMKLDVDAYFAPINKAWAWFDQASAATAVRQAKKPVIAFMAFACGGLTSSMRESAEYLRDKCGVHGILYGTTKPVNALATAKMLSEVFA